MTTLRAEFLNLQETCFSRWVERLKFFDEFGLNLHMTRAYGRAAPGQRVVITTPWVPPTHYTGVATLGFDGLTAPLLFEGGMTTALFEHYVEQILGPTLRPQEVVLLDNLPAHKSRFALRCVEARGARLFFLPPYSPDLNPIELCWAKVKAHLRASQAHSVTDLTTALAQALRAVTWSDMTGWFEHCGFM